MGNLYDFGKWLGNRVCWTVLIDLIGIGAFAAWHVWKDGTLILG